MLLSLDSLASLRLRGWDRSELQVSGYASRMIEALLGLHVSGEVNAGELLVGAGTLLLAGVTAWLARRTSQGVQQGRKSVNVAERSLEAHDWPFLVATPDTPTFDLSPTFDRDTREPTGDPEWRCDVHLVNHGRGPAILDGASLQQGHNRELIAPGWEVEEMYLPGNEARLVGIGLGGNEPPEPDEGELVLRLLYRSATGVRYETSHRLEVRSQLRAIRLDFKQTRLGE